METPSENLSGPISVENHLTKRYPLFWLWLSQMAGIYLAFQLKLSYLAGIGLALAAFTGYLIFRPNTRGRVFVLVTIVACLAFLQTVTWMDTHWEHPLLNHIPLRVSRVHGKIQHAPEGKGYLTIHIDSLHVGDSAFVFQRKVVFPFRDSTAILYADDEVEIKNVRLISLPERRNPGQWDWKHYQMMQGVAAHLEPTEVTSVIIIRTGTFSFRRTLEQGRYFLSRRIQTLFSDETEGFIEAILLGLRGQMDPKIKQEFQNLGLAHVLAISGLHVGFVVVFIHLLLLFTPLSFRWRFSAVIFILFGYMLLTGAKPPVVRATLMVTLFTFGVLKERKSSSFNLLGAAGFISLLLNPMQLFNPGYQFSFAAVGSILFFYPRFSAFSPVFVSRIRNKKIGGLIKKTVMEPLWVSLAAQLGTWPLIAWYFHKISILSLVLNLLVIPLVGVILALAGIALLFSLVSFQAGSVLAPAGDFFTNALFRLVELSAQIPFSYFNIGQVPIGWIAFYFSVLFYFIFYRNWSLQKIRAAGLVSLLLWLIFLVRPLHPQADFIVLDVGQGQSILYKSPTGQAVMIDAGPAGRDGFVAEKLILPTLHSLNLLRLNKVLITHAHDDHWGGLPFLVNTVRIDSVYLPLVSPPEENQLNLLRFLENQRLPFRHLKAGDVLKLDAQTTIYILSPLPEFSRLKDAVSGNINNTSLVCLLRKANLTALVTGDAEVPVEKALLRWGDILRADLLVVGHHGSETSSNLLFLKAVSPERSIISVGRNNRYGHPAETILKRLRRLGIAIERTDLEGAVWLKGDTDGWEKYDWR